MTTSVNRAMALKPRAGRALTVRAIFQQLGATLRFVARSSKDWSRIDSCSDAWISFPASAIKRTVFLFSSSILRRNNEVSSSILRCINEDSSSCCDLLMPCVLLSSIGCPRCELSDCTRDRRPERGHGGGCVKRLLQCSTPFQIGLNACYGDFATAKVVGVPFPGSLNALSPTSWKKEGQTHSGSSRKELQT